MRRRRFLKAAIRATAIVPITSVLSVGTSCSIIAMPGIGAGGRGGGGGGGGSEWVGRRYVTRQTRFWGFVKKPEEPWSKARLVIMNERYKQVPDRMQELAMEGRGQGFDHNYEYRLKGTFSGNEIYDPNSDKFLPEFVLRDYELINKNPEQLFAPNNTYSPYQLPARN